MQKLKVIGLSASLMDSQLYSTSRTDMTPHLGSRRFASCLFVSPVRELVTYCAFNGANVNTYNNSCLRVYVFVFVLPVTSNLITPVLRLTCSLVPRAATQHVYTPGSREQALSQQYRSL